MAVEKIIGTRGLEGNRQRFAGNRAVNDARGAQILGEEVGPIFHFLRVHQKQRATNVARTGEIFGGALADVDHTHMPLGGQRGSPGNRYGAYPEARYRSGARCQVFRTNTLFRLVSGAGRDDEHLGGAFRPGSRESEVLGVDAVRPSSFEGVYSPVHGSLHGRRTRDPPANLVRQAMQINFKG